MSRQLKELRSLMPWTWDARIEEHPAGESSLRDFKDVYRWTGDEKGRRSSAAPRDASAAPPPRNRVPKARLLTAVMLCCISTCSLQLQASTSDGLLILKLRTTCRPSATAAGRAQHWRARRATSRCVH